MLVSSTRRTTSALSKLLRWPRNEKGALAAEQKLYNEQQFLFELQKERSRVDRRVSESKFSVLLIDGVPFKRLVSDSEILEAAQERLRITDSIGWCQNRLMLLLPDTNRTGAEKVAGEMKEILESFKLPFKCDICVYPDDDNVARNSSEYQTIDFSDGEKLKYGESTDEAFREKSDGDGSITAYVGSPTPLWKRAIDCTGSLCGLIVLSPLFIVAIVAIKTTSKGPAFFRQKREGKDGRPFDILKFRTMCSDAEAQKKRLREFSEQDGPAFKLKNDPRLTSVGKYLRKSCIDELPQLFNVLKGEMSLVGPRPLPVDESFECEIWQRKRLEVVPGVTCIWQLSGGRDTKFSDWMRMDMEYIRRRSLLFDLKLIFKTVFVAVLHRGSV